MEKQKDFGFIKNLLNNIPLLKWVRHFTADGLQEKSQAESFNVEMDKDSIAIADAGLVKMFFSSSKFGGKTYASFDIKHIKEVLNLLNGEEGRLIVNESDDKRLCYIQSGNNVIVIAPTESESKGKKSNKKNQKGKGKK